ncbi:alpha-L-rhamnosidase [Alicyclobacillus cellulosilyticus]|nr:alpha-L-rhamnosidase [Alicyclobacillus cellulosilyticus]
MVHHLTCEYRRNPIGIDVAQPRFNWQIDAEDRDVMQAAYQIQVARADTSFTECVWDSGRVVSDASIHVTYAGAPLQPRTRYEWRVRVWDAAGNTSDWSETAFFETGLLRPEAWTAAWITPEFETEDGAPEASPYLRKVFTVRRGVKSARVYVTSLGLYELHLNGRRVGDWVLTPGWTSYRKRLQYQTYDVTDMLQAGENAIGAILGNGWYKGELGWQGQRNIYGTQRALILQLHITYEDGSEDVVVTDNTWKAQTGPILMSEIYHGETYDARQELTGWSEPGYDDSGWARTVVLDHPKDILIAQENLPTRVVEEIRPVAVLTTPAGETVIDMGQNMVGWVRFAVTAPAGTEIVLQHAEVLDKDGNFYTENLRSARQTIRYICRGGGREVFAPHFTFQGFRYVKVEGYPGLVSRDDFTGCVVHTDMEVTGSFECSHPLVNQLQHNIVWGQKGNFVDVPTDCPQRDERLGWTGDAQVFIRTAAFNMNVAPFFTKWLRDLRADQYPDGRVPHVIPDVLPDRGGGSAAWADAAVICPWTIYLCYGDERLLAEQYDSMKAWVEYMRRQGDNEYLFNTGFHFGDWLGLDAKEGSYKGATAEDYIATAFYAYSTRLLARAAQVLGKEDDAKAYSALHERILEHFRREFVTPNGRLAVPTQTAHVLALWFDLVAPKDRERIARTLNDMIVQNGDHLTTGFVGTPYLCFALSASGYHDTAVRLLLQETYPSWLYPVTKGATTIWEHWDGIKPDGSFWSKDMNSFNHYAYGSIGDWMYRVLAGIDTDESAPGYKRVVIHPHLTPRLSFVRAELRTMYGLVRSAWRWEDDRVVIEIAIPANTSAHVVLPGARLADVREGDAPLAPADARPRGVRSVAETADGVEVEVGSGMYCFTYAVAEV